MSISLDTPEQINAWVLLSRISQCHLHMKGLKVNGLAAWMKRNIPDITNERTVKQMYPRLLDFCDAHGVQAPGGEQCNYQVLMTGGPLTGLYLDQGIVSSMSDIEANPTWVKAYGEERLVIIRTMDAPRERDRGIQMVKEQ
jgi:hypothetical protein